MSFWGKTQCFLGFHEGEWKYTSSFECNQERICERDSSHISYRVEHQGWTDWKYIENGSCEIIRKCIRCDAKEKSTAKHNWGSWGDYLFKDDCTQERKCERCPKVETRLSHKYGYPKLIPTKVPCQLYRECSRCNDLKTLYGEKEHQWAINPEVKNQKICLRCGEDEELTKKA